MIELNWDFSVFLVSIEPIFKSNFTLFIYANISHPVRKTEMFLTCERRIDIFDPP